MSFPSPSTASKPSTGLADFKETASPPPSESGSDSGGDLFADAVEEQTPTSSVSEESESVEAEQSVTADESAEEQTTAEPEKGGRYNTRVRELANQKRQLAEENNELKELVRALRDQTMLTKEHLESQKPILDQQKSRQEKEAKRQQMVSLGFDPTDFKDHALFDVMQANLRLEAEIRAQRETSSGEATRRQIEEYSNDLRVRLKSELATFDVSGEQLEDLHAQAYEAAVARGLDSAQAAQLAAKRVKPFLRPKLTKKPAAIEAHKAIATSGRSGGASPGNRPAPTDFDSALKDLYSKG